MAGGLPLLLWVFWGSERSGCCSGAWIELCIGVWGSCGEPVGDLPAPIVVPLDGGLHMHSYSLDYFPVEQFGRKNISRRARFGARCVGNGH